MEIVYIFLYSEKNNSFESSIEKACTHYNLFELRARRTTERDVKMYSFLSCKKEVKELNSLIDKGDGEEVLKLLSKRTLIIN